MRLPQTLVLPATPAVILRGSAQELLICEIRVMIYIQKSKITIKNLASYSLSFLGI